MDQCGIKKAVWYYRQIENCLQNVNKFDSSPVFWNNTDISNEGSFNEIISRTLYVVHHIQIVAIVFFICKALSFRTIGAIPEFYFYAFLSLNKWPTQVTFDAKS